MLTMTTKKCVVRLSLVLMCSGMCIGLLRTTLEEIDNNGIVRKFSTLIQGHNLTYYFERPGITVFVPVSSVYDRFLDDAYKYGYNLSDPATIRDILLYHIGEGATSISDMETHTSSRTFHTGERHVYFNHFSYGDTELFTVNGAWIVGSDILASNGVVHIIDRFLIPVQSNKTVAQYLQQPDIPNFAFQSIKNASIVDPALKMATNSTASRFTVFAPDDSFITVMPDYGQDVLFNDTDLLKTVFWAHVIEEGTLYIPRLGEIPNTAAMTGVLKFQRVGTDIYVSSNKVRARLMQTNIPVKNGVIHVIDDLLFYIYRNMQQKIDVLKNANFIQASLENIGGDIKDTLTDRVRTMTLFLPTDDALAKLPTDRQLRLDTNTTRLSKFFRDHLVTYSERDVDSFQDGETFTTSDGEILTMRKVNNNVYVEGGGVRAKITVSDLGCTNGVIHLVNSALFQRDFTIWEAIQGNSQLSRMEEFVNLNTDLLKTLSATSNGPMTVFLISDAAINNLPYDTLKHLQSNTNELLEAIHGSIASGVILSSTQISDEQDVPTLSGRTITLYNTNQGLYVIGSRIRANVVIEDIWCSNGILHITDNIIHLPTRNIIDEMAFHPTLSVMHGLMEAFPPLKDKLKDTSKRFTMFVPNDNAFTYMPTHRAHKLSVTQGLLHSIVQSHVVPGATSYVEEYGNYTRLTSDSGHALFVIRSHDEAYAISNNVKGTVVEANIRCTNGLIHIIDTMLRFPYWTVEEMMEKTAELKPFYGLVEQVPDFSTWASTYDINQTLFVPSGLFLSNLEDHHKIRITSESGMVKKLFESHMIPALALGQSFLDNAFRSSRMFLAENRYNYTFTFIDQDTSNKTELVSVDTGYTNLIQKFDLVRDGIGCSNGIIYTINGFLNYPLYNTLSELKKQPGIGIGADQLLKLIPHNASMNLASRNTVFTVFAPADDSFNHLSLDDITYINQNLTYLQRMEIVQRHIVRGQQIEYRNIMDGGYTTYAHDRNITVISRTDGFYLKWERIEAKIIRPNILATNGVIHVVDRLLLSTPYQMTTTPQPTTTEKHVSSKNSFSASIYVTISSLIISFIACKLNLIRAYR